MTNVFLIIPKTIGKVAKTVGSAIVGFFTPPPVCERRAPHIVIKDMDTIDDYMGIESDTDFVVSLGKRLEHDLKYILGYSDDDHLTIGNLLSKAWDEHYFMDKYGLIDILHEFRKTRNEVVHGDGGEISLKDRRRWTEAVFSLEEGFEYVPDAQEVAKSEE